jgi:hypothetical protein
MRTDTWSVKTTGPLSWNEGPAELYTVQSISSALGKKINTPLIVEKNQ